VTGYLRGDAPVTEQYPNISERESFRPGSSKTSGQPKPLVRPGLPLRGSLKRFVRNVTKGGKKEIAKMHPWPAARTPLARPSPSIATGPSTDLFFPGMFLTREMSRQDLCCNLPPALAVAMQPDGERRKAAPWCKSGEASNK